jgi:thioredoxin 1
MSEVTFTDANFEAEALKGDLPVLVDFFADWCGPCKMQGPIIEELAGEMAGKAKIGKINIDARAAENTASCLFDDHHFQEWRAKQTLVGLRGKEALKAELESWLTVKYWFVADR